jgi:hypothetical protein
MRVDVRDISEAGQFAGGGNPSALDLSVRSKLLLSTIGNESNSEIITHGAFNSFTRLLKAQR